MMEEMSIDHLLCDPFSTWMDQHVGGDAETLAKSGLPVQPTCG